jgi:hypothetical protein
MIIRPAGPEDALGIAAIRAEAWRVAYRGIVPDEYLRTLSIEQRSAQQELRRQGFRDLTLWVLKDNERAIKFPPARVRTPPPPIYR